MGDRRCSIPASRRFPRCAFPCEPQSGWMRYPYSKMPIFVVTAGNYNAIKRLRDAILGQLMQRGKWKQEAKKQEARRQEARRQEAGQNRIAVNDDPEVEPETIEKRKPRSYFWLSQTSVTPTQTTAMPSHRSQLMCSCNKNLAPLAPAA